MNAMFTECCLADGVLFTEKRQMIRCSGQKRRDDCVTRAPTDAYCGGAGQLPVYRRAELSRDAERRDAIDYALPTICKQYAVRAARVDNTVLT